ncbi:hypothetical protein P3382_26910, partial [Vibrio parahaemolyticus]|nr:hypothetical protein [Vibrio parahaemolyticus]
MGGAVDDAACATHWRWINRKQLIAGISEQLVARGKHKPDRHCKDEQLGRQGIAHPPCPHKEAINRQMTGTVNNGPTYERIAEGLTSRGFPPTSLFTSHAELHVLLLVHAPIAPKKA